MSAKNNGWALALMKLVFQNVAVPLIGDAPGILGSTSAGSLYLAAHTAAESGLSAGLVVQRIDDVSTTDKTLTEWVGRIRGNPGTKVRLELFDPRQNATNMVELTRRRIQM